jgi:hypothetical protein
MAEAVRVQRRATAILRRRRDDMWIASTALLAALVALPLGANSWHGPEVASVLAVAATAMLAGQRWAVAIVVLAELLLIPTIWTRAFLPADGLAFHLVALGAMIAIVPGLLAMRRAAAALVLVTGRPRTQQVCRRVQLALVATGLVMSVLPLV